MKQSGDRVGGFTIKGRLGDEGRSTSYLAVRTGKGRRPSSVLKLLSPPAGGELFGESFHHQLRGDAADLLTLRHPALSLPHHFGFDRSSGCPYLVRPFTEGADLLTALRALSPRRQIPWLAAATEALAFLHRGGFVHGNLRPTNLTVPASALPTRASRAPRGSKLVLCDPAWWSDELAMAGGADGFASDLYDLGTMFYRALTHLEPSVGESGFPEPLCDVNPEVSINLSRVVMKLLHPDSERRYGDAVELLEDLTRLGGPREPASMSVPPGPVPECFFGRSTELGPIVRSLGESDLPAACAITGEAGIGKSSFLRRLAAEAQLHGCRTILVHCHSEASVHARPLEAIASGLIPPGARGRSLRARLRSLTGEAPDDAGARGGLVRRWLDLFTDASRGERTLFLVDDLHLADPLTVDVLAEVVRRIELARVGSSGESRGRAAPDVVVSYGVESPFTRVVAPVVEALRAAGLESPIVELRELEKDAVGRWLELAGGDARLAASILESPRVQGHPFAIRETLQIARAGAIGEVAGLSVGDDRKLDDLEAIHAGFLSSKTPAERAVLETLAVLARPASAKLLIHLLDVAAAELALALQSLAREGTLRVNHEEYFFQHSSFHLWLAAAIGRERRRALHARIAEHLEASSPDAVQDIAHHWLRSSTRRRGLIAAIAAARSLAARHEHGRALELYLTIPDLLPVADRDLRAAVLEETAEVYSRLGQHPRGLEILRGLLDSASGAREKGRLHGRIGVYSHRSGDVNEATTHLEEALRCLDGAGEIESFRERLSVESELAEIASNRGDYHAASRICQRALQGLASSAHRDDREVRRAEMVLVETLAHLKLRRFEYDEARELFEKSLRISDVVDAAREKGLILNNLGILHNQQNRFAQAIDCYRAAARPSKKLGDDIVLVNIESNLALLHAKCGDFEAAEAAIARAVDHESRCDSARTRFMRLHCAGLVDLLSGRYASGIETLGAAISLGEELKDRFLTAFDLIYLGECHLYRGETKAAAAAFERALSVSGPGSAPAPVASMVTVRRAASASLRGDAREARAMLAMYEESSSDRMEYIEAWNRVFAGWAARRLGEHDRAAGWLGAARKTFRRIRARAGELHADLELATLEMDRGRVGRARKRLETLSGARHGSGVLRNPMLAARLLTALTRLELEESTPDLQEASSLLVAAESYLIGRRLRELETTVRDLRRRVQQLTLESAKSTAFIVPSLRGDGLGDDAVLGLRSAALDLFRSVEDELGKERAAGVETSLREFERHIEELRRTSEGEPKDSVVRAEAILGRSTAMRQVTRLVRQLAPSSLPVLITGETGTGKELVARALHGESGALGPFVSVNCAALPEELLEAELFGHEQGAFTGAETERAGLLRGAAGGTVLFDEIGETTLGLQGKLLRVLDRGRVRSIGGMEEREIDARFLFTTNRDLRALVEEGAFRQDLFFRLSSLEIVVPPLRERLDDLPHLIEMVRQSSGRENAPRFSEDAARILAQHPWPGNVRELQNVVTRLVLSSAEVIGADDVQAALGTASSAGYFKPAFLRSRPLDQLVTQLEREYLVQLHADRGGDMKAVAAALGISLQALYKRFKALGLRPRDLR